MNNEALLEPTPFVPKAAAPPAAPAPTKVCFLILFNHRYDDNLAKLDRIYGGRFQHIRYLVPFYRGNRTDVFPVYYSSFQFEGYFRTAWERLRDEGFTHYFVCADDLILDPGLDETNFLDRLGLAADSGYINDLNPITTAHATWFPLLSALVSVAGKNGVNWAAELPDAATVAANCAAKGYPMGRFGWHNLRRGSRVKAFFQIFFYFALRFRLWSRDRRTDVLAPPYPLVWGNADILVIPAPFIEKFVTYCSVFAAMGVFVEVGASTALLLSCPHVVRGADDPDTIGRYAWASEAKLDEFCRGFDYCIDRLLANFDKKWFSLHPIKLSRWRFSDDK